MKEHGLIFGAVSMRGVLDGSKTMTRRVVTFDNSVSAFSRKTWDELDFDHAFVDPGPSPLGNPGPYLKVPFPKTDGFQGLPRHDVQHRVYPRVQVGDVIRCKETWGNKTDVGYVYKATDTIYVNSGVAWKSPIFMPRSASRAFLPVTGVVAQRVQDMTIEDIHAEGIGAGVDYGPAYFEEWQRHWDTINADRGHPWSRNDWVWGYEWKEVTR